MFRARAALAVEFAPGKVMWYQIEIDPVEGCEINIDRDTDSLHSVEYLEPLAYVHTRAPYIRARLAGYAVSNNPGWAPATRADSHLGDQLALPGGSVYAESLRPIDPPGGN